MPSPFRVSASLTPGSKQKLEKLKAAIDCSASYVASKAIEQWLEQNYETQMKFWGEQE
ncbi:hypothetical protein [uncultured phage_MedDCM-OCT-S31-C1]|uniref:Uncharacterized protein n=1 Tax=uncultured phage_MedDCM-OCT-S31-C1 TaxID=2740800 RepID=A0A6S4PIR2_9CAUD|nr:hypothetical protein HOQ55_gp04 [uncultured phage_MedDCM-OCT-S31-C1]BAQ94386.1 hypothetical protein [uncultured phage_MedDCM-OCT-S31-C1]